MKFLSVNKVGVIGLCVSSIGIVGTILLAWFTTRIPEQIHYVNVPLISNPATIAATLAKIPDGSYVIGVSCNGQFRAYNESAFFKSKNHVVNDVIGGQPIAITFCDRTYCTKVYTHPDSKQPLNIAVGGWVGVDDKNGSLLLRVGEELYRQDSGLSIHSDQSLPFSLLNYERMTWKEWKSKHPNTDLYIGPAIQ